ncbi:MAG: small subunit ribosomal protein S14 [Parcubacteria group bacterium Athens1014_10]|nr:MAG: small subunit ribosomal protein S14 [Parcubacteria group bacterium Athens1014_10]TSD05486.1 MAG: small subunit ribosomal protein S14 [Parcubacteria group bacterium Athens0714_12]
MENNNFMATEAQKAQSRKKPKYKSRIVLRCWRCGRKRAYMRDFGICRICFKELADKGDIPGVRKASW